MNLSTKMLLENHKPSQIGTSRTLFSKFTMTPLRLLGATPIYSLYDYLPLRDASWFYVFLM